MLEESFSQGDTTLHQLDPRTKLVAALIFSFSTAILHNICLAGLALSAAFLMAIGARLPLRRILRRLLLVNGFILFLWLFLPFSTPGEACFSIWKFSCTRQGLEFALLITLKSNAILLAGIALLCTTSIPVLGHALQRLRVTQKLSFLLLISYRYLDVIRQEYSRLSTAAKMRCFYPGTNMHTYRTYAYLLAMLLIKSHDRAQRVYQAMLLRGFQGKFYSLHTFSISAKDILFGLGITSLALGLLGTDLLWLDLSPAAGKVNWF